MTSSNNPCDDLDRVDIAQPLVEPSIRNDLSVLTPRARRVMYLLGGMHLAMTVTALYKATTVFELVMVLLLLASSAALILVALRDLGFYQAMAYLWAYDKMTTLQVAEHNVRMLAIIGVMEAGIAEEDACYLLGLTPAQWAEMVQASKDGQLQPGWTPTPTPASEVH